jgi:iron complex transport system ATP-binding protein
MNSVAISAENIRARIENRLILQDMSLSVPTGRWLSVVGPNGAGKSTLLKVLAGLLPCEGQLSLQGKRLDSLSPRERAMGLAWLAQDETGALDMRVEEVVMLGRLPRLGLWGAVSEVDHQACHQAMQQTQTLDFAQHSLGQLSAGQQQRVRLARALATQASVLLLDEPLSNLDPQHQLDWIEVIRAQVQRGVTVLTVLHELPMALLADEMVLMRSGAIVYRGACADPSTHRALEAVFDQRIRILPLEGQWAVLPQPA